MIACVCVVARVSACVCLFVRCLCVCVCVCVCELLLDLQYVLLSVVHLPYKKYNNIERYRQNLHQGK